MAVLETKYAAGWYRYSNYTGGAGIVAQVKLNKETREWEADFRDAMNPSVVVRFAGNWKTKRDAVAEVEPKVERGYL